MILLIFAIVAVALALLADLHPPTRQYLQGIWSYIQIAWAVMEQVVTTLMWALYGTIVGMILLSYGVYCQSKTFMIVGFVIHAVVMLLAAVASSLLHGATNGLLGGLKSLGGTLFTWNWSHTTTTPQGTQHTTAHNVAVGPPTVNLAVQNLPANVANLLEHFTATLAGISIVQFTIGALCMFQARFADVGVHIVTIETLGIAYIIVLLLVAMLYVGGPVTVPVRVFISALGSIGLLTLGIVAFSFIFVEDSQFLAKSAANWYEEHVHQSRLSAESSSLTTKVYYKAIHDTTAKICRKCSFDVQGKLKPGYGVGNTEEIKDGTLLMSPTATITTEELNGVLWLVAYKAYNNNLRYGFDTGKPYFVFKEDLEGYARPTDEKNPTQHHRGSATTFLVIAGILFVIGILPGARKPMWFLMIALLLLWALAIDESGVWLCLIGLAMIVWSAIQIFKPAPQTATVTATPAASHGHGGHAPAPSHAGPPKIGPVFVGLLGLVLFWIGFVMFNKADANDIRTAVLTTVNAAKGTVVPASTSVTTPTPPSPPPSTGVISETEARKLYSGFIGEKLAPNALPNLVTGLFKQTELTDGTIDIYLPAERTQGVTIDNLVPASDLQIVEITGISHSTTDARNYSGPEGAYLPRRFPKPEDFRYQQFGVGAVILENSSEPPALLSQLKSVHVVGNSITIRPNERVPRYDELPTGGYVIKIRR